MYPKTHTKRPKRNQKRSVPSLHKNGELAVFYNLAYNRTSTFIKTIQRKDKAHEFTELRDVFFPMHSETGIRKSHIDETILDNKIKGLTDRAYSELKVFLWNAAKGKNIRFVTPQDIKEINHVLLLLLRLRDYHSHFWHEDTALYPTPTTRLVLDRTFQIAVHSYQPQIDFAVDVTLLTHCWDTKDANKLGTMGINFFLVFFLTKGQMELFMKSRQYLNRGGYSKPPTELKRSHQKESYLIDAQGNFKKRPDGSVRSGNDILDLEKSRFITSFYAQRDASESAAYWLGKHMLFSMDVQQFHVLQLSNYLESIPGYLYTNLSDAMQLEEVQRTSRRPTALLATSIALATGEIPNLAWRVYSDEVIQKKVTHTTKTKEDLQKIPESYYKTQPIYVSTLGTIAVTADRLDQETETIQEAQLQLFQELYVSNDRVMIRLEVAANTYVHMVIGHENIKHWAALTTMNQFEKSVEALTAFAKAYTAWLEQLSNNTLFDIKQSYLRHFNGETYPDGSCKYHSLLPKILLQLQEENRSDTEAMTVLKARIKQKLTHILQKDNPAHFAALVDTYNSPAYQTGYLAKKEQEQYLKKINRIQNLIKAKKATSTNLAEKKRLEREWEGKTHRDIRHKKMQLLYRSISWILGRKGKFITKEAKKQFAKYCYLLDMQHWKEENLVLIADWLNVACTAKINLKKHTNDTVEIYQKKVKKALLQATSFDDCFTQITHIALDKYQEELTNVETYTRYENLIGLARKLNISNPSNTKKSTTVEDHAHMSRRAEILAPFYRQEEGNTHCYIHLPHDFFLIAPKTREKLHQFKHLPEVKQCFSDIHSHWKSLSDVPTYQTYLDDFKTINSHLREAKAASQVEEAMRLKVQRDHIKHHYKNWYTDTVLTLLQSKLQEKDARLPTGWQKKKVGRIRKHKQLFFSKEIQGVTVLFTLKQLKNHDFYHGLGKKGPLIDLIIQRLQKENPEKTSYTYEEIKTALQLHWKESIAFVSAILQFEQRHPKSFTAIGDVYKERLGYASFEAFKHPLGTNFTKINEARNYAFHGDVLAPNDSYTDSVRRMLGYKKKPYRHQEKRKT
ncbi:hypothetical protein [uncultured Dokdonia sp.]|uniref:hypothetical protein n=1 Tax=uncultured Dokdonia sp. TaxID=575653 RepID=UPI002630E329|nr:hypothetical protein [uncultured Dokdonia sp.]